MKSIALALFVTALLSLATLYGAASWSTVVLGGGIFLVLCSGYCLVRFQAAKSPLREPEPR